MRDEHSEIRDALRKENWSIAGPNCIVKVLPYGVGVASSGGYITLGKYLIGKTPQQIEASLGLPKGRLARGARVYKFKRLPMQHEYDYELTTDYPDGLVFNPAHSDPNYPPGSKSIHQWQIKPGVQIPVDTTNCMELKPTQRFPYGWL